MRGPLSQCLASLAAAFACIAAAHEPDFVADFESAVAGEPFVSDLWSGGGFTPPAWQQGFDEGRVFVDGSFPRAGSKFSIRVAFPAGGVGPQESGAQAPLELPPRKEYFLSYWLRFGEGFSWGQGNHGGKLPGLASGALCSGGEHCDGSNGFTARLMWRREGRAVLYLYHMDKPSTYGQDFPLVYPDGDDAYFRPGQWMRIVERIRVNAVGESDGEAQLWIDGEPVLLITGLRFVANGDQVDRLFFSAFHGGADPSWAPVRDSYINFDDFRVGISYAAVTDKAEAPSPAADLSR